MHLGRGGRRLPGGSGACAGAAGVRLDGFPIALGTAGAAVSSLGTRLVVAASFACYTLIGVNGAVCMPCATGFGRSPQPRLHACPAHTLHCPACRLLQTDYSALNGRKSVKAPRA